MRTRADLELARSKESEKVRNYFLKHNGDWQMEALTRQVDDNDERRRKENEDREAAIIEDANQRREGER